MTQRSEQLGVSVHSLHRYITMLDDMGIPDYSKRGPYGGFSLVSGCKSTAFESENKVTMRLRLHNITYPANSWV